MPETKIERKISYEFGPNGNDFEGMFGGFYTWDQMDGFIRDERWGSPYKVTARIEREITYGDWTEVDVPE